MDGQQRMFRSECGSVNDCNSIESDPIVIQTGRRLTDQTSISIVQYSKSGQITDAMYRIGQKANNYETTQPL